MEISANFLGADCMERNLLLINVCMCSINLLNQTNCSFEILPMAAYVRLCLGSLMRGKKARKLRISRVSQERISDDYCTKQNKDRRGRKITGKYLGYGYSTIIVSFSYWNN